MKRKIDRERVSSLRIVVALGALWAGGIEVRGAEGVVAAASEGEVVFVRDIAGGVALGGGRVLAWESISDGRHINQLWLFEPGKAPRRVGELSGETTVAAAGGDAVVFVADRKVFVSSRSNPGTPEPVEAGEKWLCVVHGPKGFVIGGGEDAFASSVDGKTWTVGKLEAPGSAGDLFALASGGGQVAVLRHTSREENGWGINSSEVCVLGEDGKTWRKLGGIDGGPARRPLESLTWGDGRWVAVGLDLVFTVRPDKTSEIVTTEFPPESFYGLSGLEPLFHSEGRWRMVYADQVFESDNLARWRKRATLADSDQIGAWVRGGEAPVFVGRATGGAKGYAVRTLAAIIDPGAGGGSGAGGVAAVSPAAAPAAAMASANDTVYDWPALVAEAEKRSAGRSLITDASFKPKGGKTPLSLGRRWSPADIIAAMEKGADVREVMRTISSDNDGSEIDMPGALKVLTHPAWRKALDAIKNDPAIASDFGIGVELWGHVYQRSVFADELARLAIARRQSDVTPAVRPVDDAGLRRRYAEGDPAAAYALYLLYYDVSSGAKDQRPEGVPPYAEVVARATAGDYAPAQWLRATDARTKPSLEKLALIRRSAESGDARGAFELAKLFDSSDDGRVTEENYAEIEYWLLEAATRGWPGQMEQPYCRPWLELANLYSGRGANDVHAMIVPGYKDASARWLRELQARGGALAEHAGNLVKDIDRESSRGAQPFDYANRIKRIPPERAPFAAGELAALEAGAARKEASALLTLAEARAGGRGLRQDDVKAVALYRAAAEAGAGLPAYRALAYRYRKGYGVEKNPGELIAWMKKAADTGDTEAIRALADIQYYHDSDKHGVPQNHVAAAALYEKIAARDDVIALQNLATMHRLGRGVPVDETKARGYEERAAALGSVSAMTSIAYRFIGRDIPSEKRDYPAAIAWYRKAVAAGDTPSLMALADALAANDEKAEAKQIYIRIAEADRLDYTARYHLAQMALWGGEREEAITWFRQVAKNRLAYDFMRDEARRVVGEYEEEEKAAPGSLPHYRKLARAGGAEEWFRYGVRYLASTKDENARMSAWAWVNDAAKAGHAMATTMYYGDITRRDKAAAAKWLRELADKGNSQAVLMVGLETAATEKAAGLALIEKAAAAGNAEAKFRLGMMRYQGQELPLDRDAGITLVTEAADAGFGLAQFTLGKGLLGGDAGLTADPARGVVYLQKATAQEFQAAVALQAWVLLGQVYQNGQVAGVPRDLGKAVKAFEAAAKLDPNNAKLREHLNQLQREYSVEMKMGKR